MNLRLLSAALTCLLIPLLEGTVRGAAATEHSPLEEHMEEINAAYRRLGRQVADPAKNADSLKQVAIIRDRALQATKHEPAKTVDLPVADRAKFVADYRTKMKTFHADVGRLEDALKAGKNDEAANVLKVLKQAQDDGHKQFRRKKVTFEEKAAAAALRSEKFNEEVKAAENKPAP